MTPRGRAVRAAALAAVAVAIAIAGAGTIYGVAEWKLQRRYDAPLLPLRAASPPDLAEGERMARYSRRLSNASASARLMFFGTG